MANDVDLNPDAINETIKSLNEQLKKLANELEAAAAAAKKQEDASTDMVARKKIREDAEDKQAAIKQQLNNTRLQQENAIDTREKQTKARVLAHLKELGQALGQTGKALYSGGDDAASGMKIFEAEVDAAAAGIKLAITGIGIALTLATGGFSKIASLALTGVILLVDGLAEAAKIAADQALKEFETYQKLSRVGATAADGLDGVFEGAQKMGYGIEQLGAYSDLIASRSSELAMIGGTVNKGLESFQAMSDEMIHGTNNLRELGFTTDSINAGIGLYILRMSKLGGMQTMTQAQQNKAASEYIKQLDVLSRATGLQAKQIADAQDAARTDDRYRARLSELGPDSAAGKALEDSIGMHADNPAIQNMIKEASIGMANTEGGQQALLSMGKEAFDMIHNAQSAQEIQAALMKGKEFARNQYGTQLAQTGALGSVTGEGNLAAFANYQFKDINAATKAQAAEPTAGISNMASAAKQNMLARESLQDFVQMGVGPATSALKIFADAAAGGTGLLPGGKSPTPSNSGSIESTPKQQADSKKNYNTFSDTSGGVSGGVSSDIPKKSGVKSSENPELQQLMQAVTAIAGDKFNQITSEMDGKHTPGGQHSTGNAFDFTVKDGQDAAALVADLSKKFPNSYFQDEYTNPSKLSTGDHIHAQLKKLATGGIIAGPTTGYQAMLHGTEAVVPLPDGRSIPVTSTGREASLSTEILSAKLDEMIEKLSRSNDIATRILSASHS